MTTETDPNDGEHEEVQETRQEGHDEYDPRNHISPHPDCEMPDCLGDSRDETHAVRGPGGEVLEMCDSCLDSGWAADVEVLD